MIQPFLIDLAKEKIGKMQDHQECIAISLMDKLKEHYKCIHSIRGLFGG
jgi:hypothetical protein